MGERVTPVWRARALLGEGPVYDARDEALYFVDIKGQELCRFGLEDGAQRRWAVPEPIGWVAPRAAHPGFVAGFKSGFALLDLDPFHIVPLGSPEPERATNRLNDAKVDAQGRIWAGSKDDEDKRTSGALYRLDPTLCWTRVDDGYGVANGPTFSLDGRTLYHADSAARVVYRFNVAADGSVSERKVFVRFDEAWGYPDGMTTDAEDGVWIAHWDGARISRFTPDGALDRSIAFPVSRPTSCAFAGRSLQRMFVTSAAVGGDDEELAGSLFEVDAGVRGAPTFAFAG